MKTTLFPLFEQSETARTDLPRDPAPAFVDVVTDQAGDAPTAHTDIFLSDTLAEAVAGPRAFFFGETNPDLPSIDELLERLETAAASGQSMEEVVAGMEQDELSPLLQPGLSAYDLTQSTVSDDPTIALIQAGIELI